MPAPRRALMAAAGSAGSAGGGDVLPLGTDLDGTNDYLSISGALTGNSDGKEFTLSFWIYNDEEADNHWILSNYDTGYETFYMYLSAAGGWNLGSKNTSAAANLFAYGPATSDEFPSNTWIHFLVSVDLADTGNRSVYINDEIASATWSTYGNSNIDFTSNNYYAGTKGSLATDTMMKGRLANLYLDYTYRDMATEGNRRLFNQISDTEGLIPSDSLPSGFLTAFTDPDDLTANDGTSGDAWTVNGTMARSNRGANQWNAAASTFDGSADYVHSTGLTGASGSKVFTCNFDIKTTNAVFEYVWAIDIKVVFQIDTAGYLRLYARNSAGTLILNATVTEKINNDRNWNVSVIIDMADTGKRFVYLNGVSASVTWSTYTNDTIDITDTMDVGVGASSTGSGHYAMDLGNFYFDTSYVDIPTDDPLWDAETNKPKHLGEDGELPTGSSPLIYLPLRADDAGNNLGTGGDFTVNSGPFTGARGGSEYWARSMLGAGGLGRINNTTITNPPSTSKTISVAYWFNVDVANTSDYILNLDTGAGAQRFLIGETLGKPFVQAISSAGSNILLATAPSAASVNTWHSVLASFDLSDTGKRQMYIDGVSVTPTYQFYSNTDMDWANLARLYVGSSAAHGQVWDGEVSNLYVTSEYIDFSDEDVRLQFIDDLGYPRPLDGLIADATIPEPFVFFKFEDPNSLETNSGTANGTYAIVGSILPGADVNG